MNEQQHQMPGPWYFEVGTDSSNSPTELIDQDFALSSLHAALNSLNITESVDVPSSEHVAEIVGRQGCKIKALRAKTNTYIKTPVRGEEPVFVVTGRAEDVADAKREIECAAEHFTQIRASRRHSQGGIPAPGHITAYVRVPLRVVGLVVGPKGATIKRIQQDTHTYIITPSREREPIFEVTGLPQNVEAARREIEQHIYQRTGNMPITDPTVSISAYDLQGNLSSTTLTARTASTYGGSGGGGTMAPMHNPNQQTRRASTLFDQNGICIDDFHRNGNDVIYTGGAPMMRNAAVSKPYSAGDSPPPSVQHELQSFGGLSLTSSNMHHELISAALRNQQQSCAAQQLSSSSMTSSNAYGGAYAGAYSNWLSGGSYPTWSSSSNSAANAYAPWSNSASSGYSIWSNSSDSSSSTSSSSSAIGGGDCGGATWSSALSVFHAVTDDLPCPI